MKVYQLNVVAGSGSTGRIVVDIARMVMENGGESRIAFGRGGAPAGIDNYRIGSRFDVYYHALMSRLTGKHGLYSNDATRRLICDIKKYNPDIIHLHNIHGYYLNYEILFKYLERSKIKVVWTMHDCWAFTGHCAHFDYVGCDKWKLKCQDCVQRKEYPSSWVKDASQNNYERKKELFTSLPDMTIVAVSNWLNSVLKNSFLGNLTIKTIYNGIDLEVFKPAESNLREMYGLESKKVILGVANIWSRRKGLDTFRELSNVITDDIQIVLIGLSSKQCRQMPEKILCLERTANIGELVQWYSAADVYVNASVEESMGLTTIEALACGTPAIVMNKTANPELVDELCGRVVEPYDTELLLKAIQETTKSKDVVRACRSRALNFDKKVKCDCYLNLYREAMGVGSSFEVDRK